MPTLDLVVGQSLPAVPSCSLPRGSTRRSHSNDQRRASPPATSIQACKAILGSWCVLYPYCPGARIGGWKKASWEITRFSYILAAKKCNIKNKETQVYPVTSARTTGKLPEWTHSRPCIGSTSRTRVTARDSNNTTSYMDSLTHLL